VGEAERGRGGMRGKADDEVVWSVQEKRKEKANLLIREYSIDLPGEEQRDLEKKDGGRENLHWKEKKSRCLLNFKDSALEGGKAETKRAAAEAPCQIRQKRSLSRAPITKGARGKKKRTVKKIRAITEDRELPECKRGFEGKTARGKGGHEGPRWKRP